jgi:hypothetical protein
MFIGEPPEECPMCKIKRLEARVAELEAKLNNAEALVVDMECSCLPYAKPSDGMCERCMFFFNFGEERQ